MNRIQRVFVSASLVIAAGCASPGPTLVSEPDRSTPVRRSYSPMAGSFPVGVIPEGTLRDATRGKDVPLSIEYPTRPGPHPVIIFSHGFGGSRSGYEPLASYWTSHGYVVIRPSHADSGALKNPADRETTWDAQSVEEWRNRVRDITAILDGFTALETQFPELKGKLDATRIGVGGHSYGAFTAMLIGGMMAEKNGVRLEMADPRVKAVLAMAPQGRSVERGLGDDSWRNVTIPALFMIGGADRVGMDRPANGRRSRRDPEPAMVQTPVVWQSDAFDLSPTGDKYLLVIRGARHMSFTGRLGDLDDEEIERRRRAIRDQTPMPGTTSTAGRPIPSGAFEAIAGRERRVAAVIRSSSLAFWDAYLRTGTSGRDYLGKMATDDVEVKTK